ncbi:MAG: TonB-dependent receptor, partial [Pseudomonadales bacterium]|nr:TonB-dependent receptor [Pseudomonadales bacterium]
MDKLMKTTPVRRRGRMVSTLTGLCALGALQFAMAADQTTGSVRGQVTGPDGRAVSGAVVTLKDERNGSSRQIRPDADGKFSTTGLKVGGPYEISVTAGGYGGYTVEGVTVSLGNVTNVNFTLNPQTMEEIVVQAQALNNATVAMGPASGFSLADMEMAPAINRDIKDLIRLDPRVYVDEAFVDGIQCAGANPRFNSLTVDGVRLNDNFGLNSNGYPTERMPFSYDSLQQVAVELAPFDVQFGGFSACNINAVTRSGTNRLSASVFYDYTSDSLQGDKLEGTDIDLGSFSEDRYGVTLGGPLIADTLFGFLAYEKLKGAEVFDRGPAGSGRGREVAGVSVAQYDQILAAAKNLYNYDPGSLPASLPVEDEKLLLRMDWQISDAHRAAFTYTYNDGFNISESDGDSNELEFSNHYYERGAELNAYVAQMFSDWSDTFSTELRISYSELKNRQISLAGTDFGEVQITTTNDHDNDGVASRATVYLGADDSRHANKLSYENLSYKAAFSWFAGDHLISGGYEREEFDGFNLFIQEAEGEYRFSSIQDFLDGRPNRITYENAAPSNNPDDAAASFRYGINTLYLQDEYS